MGFGGASAAKVEELIEAAHTITNAAVAVTDARVQTVDGKVVVVDTVVDAVKAKTDNLPSDPASESGTVADVETDVARKYPFLDFWSLPADKITIPITASVDDLDFPSVLVEGLPALATIKRVVAILTIRALLDTSTADNYIELANKTLRVMKSNDTAWGTDDVIAIKFDQLSLWCVASTKEAGPTIIGSYDVRGEVDGDATYNFRSEETERGDAISAKGSALELYDVQVGLRVFYE